GNNDACPTGMTAQEYDTSPAPHAVVHEVPVSPGALRHHDPFSGHLRGGMQQPPSSGTARDNKAQPTSPPQPAVTPHQVQDSKHTPAALSPAITTRHETATYKTTAALIAGLETANSEAAREALEAWLGEYIHWFTQQPLSSCTKAVLTEYTLLSQLASNKDLKTASLGLRYFESLVNKLPEQYAQGEERLLQALSESLVWLSPTIFAGRTEPLTQLCEQLLSRLIALEAQDLQRKNYSSHQHTFEALHLALVHLRAILKDKDKRQGWEGGGRYARYKKALKALQDRVKEGDYGFTYQTLLVLQSLKHLKEPPLSLKAFFKALSEDREQAKRLARRVRHRLQ
ncbi:MAG: hypothetical protein AAFQ08_04095, partial [Bacteroidota bacterium]